MVVVKVLIGGFRGHSIHFTTTIPLLLSFLFFFGSFFCFLCGLPRHMEDMSRCGFHLRRVLLSQHFLQIIDLSIELREGRSQLLFLCSLRHQPLAHSRILCLLTVISKSSGHAEDAAFVRKLFTVAIMLRIMLLDEFEGHLALITKTLLQRVILQC